MARPSAQLLEMPQDSLTMHSMRLDANTQVSGELGFPKPERVLLSTERRVSAAPPGYLRSVLAAEGILESEHSCTIFWERDKPRERKGERMAPFN